MLLEGALIEGALDHGIMVVYKDFIVEHIFQQESL